MARLPPPPGWHGGSKRSGKCFLDNEAPSVVVMTKVPYERRQAKQNWTIITCSSVARGGPGGLEPPLACEVCKIARFWCFWGRFLVKNWKQPPPQRKLGAEVLKYMSWFGLKKRLNFRFLPKNQSQFRWWPFFVFVFLEITCFWAEKTFEFPSFPRNSVSIFGQTERFWFKNNENSGQGRLHFSHSFKKPPLFQILATRQITCLGQN